MNWEVVWGPIRHVLTGIGGYALAKGWLDEASATAVLTAIGTIGAVVWSVVQKLQAARKTPSDAA